MINLYLIRFPCESYKINIEKSCFFNKNRCKRSINMSVCKFRISGSKKNYVSKKIKMIGLKKISAFC